MSCPERKHRPDIACHILSVSFHYVTRRQNTSLLLRDLIHPLSQGLAKCSDCSEGSATDRYDPYFVLCMLFAFCSSSTPYDCRLYSWSNPCDCFHLFFWAWAFEAWQRMAKITGKQYMESLYGIMGSAGFIVLYYVVLCCITGFTWIYSIV